MASRLRAREKAGVEATGGGRCAIMASPLILDFEALLSPIEGDGPAGQDPRKEASPYPLFGQLRDERNKARRAERGSAGSDDDEDRILQSQAMEAWAKVLDLSQQVLLKQGKDLEVVSYLAEALVRQRGLAGLRDAFQLTRRMVELYWDDLYPHPGDESEDPIAVKVKPIGDLSGTESDGPLIEAMRMLPITDPDSPGPFRLGDYQGATGDRPNAELLEQIKASARTSPVSFYKDLIDDRAACGEEHAKVTALLDEKCGEQSPPSSRIRNALDDIRGTINYITEGMPGLEKEPVAAEEEETEEAEKGDEKPRAVPTASGESAPATAISGTATIGSREEAFNALLRIAKYFREAEPHSPLSYALEELVRRGRLPFIDLLKELMPNDETRRDMLTRAGIAQPSPSPPTEDQ